MQKIWGVGGKGGRKCVCFAFRAKLATGKLASSSMHGSSLQATPAGPRLAWAGLPTGGTPSDHTHCLIKQLLPAHNGASATHV